MHGQPAYPAPPSSNTQPALYSVTQLNQQVRELLENSCPENLWVSGEVSNLTIHNSGHLYLSLKDAGAQVSATWFRGADFARQIGLTNGMEVEVQAKVSLYEPRGQYQLNIRQLRLKGAGSLQMQFEMLKQRLQDEGLFDPARKKRIPPFPRCVGVITSPEGAALRDFLQIIERRFNNLHIRIFPAHVQGPKTPREVAAGIRYFNRHNACDVIVITRGGGSMEDLWGFNHEQLCRIIAESRIPTISAVGHEVDFTICDFVSDLRVPTPSAAAELVVSKKSEIIERLQNLKRRAHSAIQLQLSHARRRFERARHSYVFREPMHMIQKYAQRMDELQSRLQRGLRVIHQQKQQKLQHVLNQFPHLIHELQRREKDRLAYFVQRNQRAIEQLLQHNQRRLTYLKQQLQALSPQRVMERGFAVIQTSDGTIVTSSDQLKIGEQATARLAEGAAQITINHLYSEKPGDTK